MSPEQEIESDVDWLLSHPQSDMGSKYHDSSSCWKIIESMRIGLLSASPGVEVKPLEWESDPGYPDLHFTAQSIVGTYILWVSTGECSAFFPGAASKVVVKTAAEAKQSCDAHYRARIGLALRTAGGGG